MLTEGASQYELIYFLKDRKQASVLAVLDRLERRHKGRFRERIEKWMNAYPRRIFGYQAANDTRIT